MSKAGIDDYVAAMYTNSVMRCMVRFTETASTRCYEQCVSSVTGPTVKGDELKCIEGCIAKHNAVRHVVSSQLFASMKQ